LPNTLSTISLRKTTLREKDMVTGRRYEWRMSGNKHMRLSRQGILAVEQFNPRSLVENLSGRLDIWK
jgi:hypothetical protein